MTPSLFAVGFACTIILYGTHQVGDDGGLPQVHARSGPGDRGAGKSFFHA